MSSSNVAVLRRAGILGLRNRHHLPSAMVQRICFKASWLARLHKAVQDSLHRHRSSKDNQECLDTCKDTQA